MKPYLCPNCHRRRRRISRLRSFLASCRLKFAPAERTIPFPQRRRTTSAPLHGYPETHVTWHKVAPRLARGSRSTYLTCEDTGIRAPADGDRHPNYSFAQWVGPGRDDGVILGTSSSLWCPRSRCSRRKSALSRLSQRRQKGLSQDIAPTLTMYRQTNQSLRRSTCVVLPYPRRPC